MTDTLWGVGTYEDGTTRVPWEISHAEIERDMGSAARTLSTLGVTGGSRVLFCSMLSEAGQFWPLTVGAMLSGAQLSCADANEGDALRIEMFTRLVEYRAVLGVTGAILDGLDALGHSYAEVLGRVEIIGARPDAYQRLQADGLNPHHFVCCGPAIAAGAAPGAPARFDTDEWQLETDADGRILVTSLQPRATAFARAGTAVYGELVDGGLIPRTQTRPTQTSEVSR
jgi:hypothetical protein